MNIQFIRSKGKLILFGFILILLVLLVFLMVRFVYSSYETDATLDLSIDEAIYIFSDEKMSFNIDSNKIVPSSTPYTYTFSVSNFKDSKTADVDLLYTIQVISTTNLPITMELYRNETYSPSSTTIHNIIGTMNIVQDTDGAWYREYSKSSEFEMLYRNNTTDIYTLVVKFPASYSGSDTYADAIENIEIRLESKQEI